jgi:hypothetical protein
VNANFVGHNFELRSCPSATSPCTDGNGAEQEITALGKAEGLVTVKVNLRYGTYRLFCDAAGHEAGGMYVDFEVGGVGQLG